MLKFWTEIQIVICQHSSYVEEGVLSIGVFRPIFPLISKNIRANNGKEIGTRMRSMDGAILNDLD